MKNIFKEIFNSDNNATLLSLILSDKEISLNKLKKLCQKITKELGEQSLVEIILQKTDNSESIISEITQDIAITFKVVSENGNFNDLAVSKSTGNWLFFTDLSVNFSNNFFSEFKKSTTDEKILSIIPKTLYKKKSDGVIQDKNPTGYMFKKGKSVKLARLLSDHLLLTEKNCFLNTKLVKESELKIPDNENYKFSNPQFINALADKFRNENIIFLGKASVIKSIETFYNPLHDGHETPSLWAVDYLKDIPLKIVEHSKIKDKVPTHIQCLLIYEVFRRISFFVNRKDRASLLTSSEQNEFIRICKEIMAQVDEKYINSYVFKGFVEEHKVAFLSLFKNSKRPVTSMYIHDLASRQGRAQFFYMSGEIEDETSINISVNGKIAQQSSASHTRIQLFDSVYCVKQLFWINFKDHDFVSFMVDGVFANIKNGGKTVGKTASWLEIRNSLTRAEPGDLTKSEEEQRKTIKSSFSQWCNAWLFADRQDKADDNAEHFYRHVKNNKLHKDIFFVLSKESSDWNRLKDEGFNLIDYGSDEHLACLAHCRFLISSQAGHALFHPRPTKCISDLLKYRFIFLQHGIIMTDISKWLNSVKMKKFITSTPQEYNYISGNEGNFKFTDVEVCLTGMPRHDYLIKNKNKIEADTILIMPTWRRYLTLEPKEVGGPREPLPNFLETVYARNWIGLLSDEKLKLISEESGLKVKFAMHPNLSIYVNEFKIPDYIEVIDVTDNFSYSNQILESAVLITDYSSIAFDAAIIDRAVMYFQFDKEDFASGRHTSVDGYFDFEEDGFGSVSYDANKILSDLKLLLSTGENEIYKTRRSKTFTKRDGNSCARVYNEICSLDE